MTGPEPVAQVLADARALAADAAGATGVRWKLAESGRQLDANLVHLAPGEHIATHAEPDLDVLVLVVSGGGLLATAEPGEPHTLAEGSLVWLPHGSTRSITAGDTGLDYLTVHRRRPGMQIRPSR
ncbi:cupin domain-containing protein [Streptomyces sp. NPDC049040]|uniref:cupin domain-containing protein n=1 Tax=Streptomyces sp. NPDC049040 TaxID=3365593 RepID=UPI0037171DC1